MSYASTDIFVLQKVTKEPIAGVLVRVLSVDGASVFTEGTTDAEGKAEFLLPCHGYELRFFKQQMCLQPLHIEVLEATPEAPTPNKFNVYAEVLVPPVSNDPRLCRVSGYFRDITGAPRSSLDIIFVGDFGPILLEGAGVLPERRPIRTNEKGYACIDLIRCANYSATVEGHEDKLRTVSVPDTPSANLPALLFPTVESVSFETPAPWIVPLNGQLQVQPVVLTSSRVPTRGPDAQNVEWRVEDPSVATLVMAESHLILVGVKSGTSRLLAKRRDLSIMTIPFSPYLIGSGKAFVVQ